MAGRLSPIVMGHCEETVDPPEVDLPERNTYNGRTFFHRLEFLSNAFADGFLRVAEIRCIRRKAVAKELCFRLEAIQTGKSEQ